jgi:hypothetical protein
MDGSPATLRGGEIGAAGTLHGGGGEEGKMAAGEAGWGSREEARAGTRGMCRWPAVWQRSGMRRSRGAGRLTGGPGCCIVPILIFFKSICIDSIQWLPSVHKIFQIKYVHVDNLIRNKLPHRSFLKFKTEFELKIREPRILGIWELQNLMGLDM